MAKWRVEYQGADKKSRTTVVTLDDSKYTTAAEVTSGLSEGSIPDLYVKPGHVILVQKDESTGFAFR